MIQNMPGMQFALPQPQQPMRPLPQPQQPMRPLPQPSQATQWQPAAKPAVVRGVAAEAPPKFVLPRPESLGVATNLNVAQPQPAAPVQIDWNQVQTRLARLNVVSYHKTRLPTGGVQVAIVLPNAVQPVEAQGESEAAAILSVLQLAEARQR